MNRLVLSENKKLNVRYITSLFLFRFQHKCDHIRPEEHIFIHGLVAFSLCCACWGGLDLRERGRISVR